MVSAGITQKGSPLSLPPQAITKASIAHRRQETAIRALACGFKRTRLIIPTVIISSPQSMTASISIRHTALLTPTSAKAPATGSPYDMYSITALRINAIRALSRRPAICLS